MRRKVLTNGSGSWFNEDTARSWASTIDCGEKRGETLWLTSSGVWILEQVTGWDGEDNKVDPCSEPAAVQWLSENLYHEAEGLPVGVLKQLVAMEI